MEHTSFTTDEYRKRLDDVAAMAAKYAKTGMGYHTMRKSFNELCEGAGANHACGNDAELIKQGRRIIAQRIGINTLSQMPTEMNRRLLAELVKIANEDAPIQVTTHRDMRR